MFRCCYAEVGVFGIARIVSQLVAQMILHRQAIDRMAVTVQFRIICEEKISYMYLYIFQI